MQAQEAMKDGALERAVIESAPDGVMLVDRQGVILMVNAAMEQIAGRDKAQLLGKSINILMPAHMHQRHDQMLEHFFASPTRRPMGVAANLLLPRPDGTQLAVDISLSQCEVGGKACAVVFVRDLTDIKRLEEQMHYHATHDALTGLANRWQFMQQLMYAIAQSERSKRGLALLLLDLDDFKAINDGHGHGAGDQVLVQAARRMRAALRSGDFLGRLGGDEFTVLLPQVRHSAEIEQLLHRLRDTLAEPFQVNSYTVQMGVSIGVACYPADAEDGETLMRYADMAMYQAKAAGRNTYAVYQSEMGQKMLERMVLHDRLKQALKNNALQLHYQPQVDLRSGRVNAVEALLRWHDPDLGDVAPARFIPVAESTGLILALGDWVMETACRQQAAWAQEGLHLQVAINLSARQLRQPDLVERLSRLLAQMGVDPAAIELEITESEAMADPEQAARVLGQLAALGVRLALDDFGTGHSSLSYLKVLPVQRIKIDRDFVRNVTQHEGDAKLVRAVIALAHTLGLDVVAEGVETVEQLEFLCECDCEAYQGWLIAKAMPASELASWLRKRLSDGTQGVPPNEDLCCCSS